MADAAFAPRSRRRLNPRPLRDGADAPFFELRIDAALASYLRIREAFNGANVAYALKANSCEPLLIALNEAGAKFEAASWGEIELLRSVGVLPDHILYGTAVKPARDVEKAVAFGIDRFAADSREELEMLSRQAPGSRVVLRTRANESSSVFRPGLKYGAEISDATALLLLAMDLGLRPWGLSFNVGSNAMAPGVWAEGVAGLAPVIGELKQAGISLQILDIGGGFPATDTEKSNLEDIARAVLLAKNALPYPLELTLEPGRRIAASALRLHTTVIRRIQRANGPWLFLDCGVYNALFEALSCQGRTRYPIQNASKSGVETLDFIIAGPTGDGLDVLAEKIALPRDTGEGDHLIFEDAGAYTLSVASTFNGFPIPPVR